MEYKIQSLVFPTEAKHQQCRDLFFHGYHGYLDRANQCLSLSYGQNVDFTTYINACSYEKWRTYTKAGRAVLYLDVQGDFRVCYLGYRKEVVMIERTEFASEEYHLTGRQTVRFMFPENQERMLGFELYPLGPCTIFGGYYTLTCEESDLNDVTLCIATTTCRKEEFIKKNVELLKSKILEQGDDAARDLYVHVVDNGRTLTERDISGKHVCLHPNHNTGGSGGYARGMIESLNQTPKATHVLLMDDDVLVLPESIVRTYKLLRLMKPEYQDHFISGAMLYYEEPYRQHEDIGTVRSDGVWLTLKPRYDHGFLDSNLDNEKAFVNQKNEYAGWWYCCIPARVIEKNGLPLPVFIRGDDVEYSLRCKAEILTMNGIFVWHMGFVTKYNAALVEYQEFRNMLIAKACSDILEDTDIYGITMRAYRAAILKFHYEAAELVLRGFEDFLKGPSFLEVDHGERILKENSKLNDEMVPLNDIPGVDILDVFSCYYDPPRKGFETFLYRLTYNGHRFWPKFLRKKKYGYIAFDHSYQPSKMVLREHLVAVNPYTRTGKLRTMDKSRYKALMARYRKAVRYYRRNRKKIENDYRDARGWLTCEEFWRKYLEIPEHSEGS